VDVKAGGAGDRDPPRRVAVLKVTATVFTGDDVLV
jgi:hypothetical protein